MGALAILLHFQHTNWYTNDADFMELYIDSVQHAFGNRALLTDVFLQCSKGEIIGLLGRNGSGKSTLMRIIFGSLKADFKFVRVGDQVIKNLSENNGLIGYLPQDQFLPPELRIEKIINLFCSANKAEEMKALDLVKPHLSATSRSLSGGERRTIELLLFLHSDFPFLLLDEPFNGLSPVQVERISLLINQLGKQKGIILSDHYYEQVLAIATRVVLLRDGALKTVSGSGDLMVHGYLPMEHQSAAAADGKNL